MVVQVPLLALLMFAAGCGRSPEAVGVAAMAARCNGEPERFEQSLTAESLKLFRALRAAAPARFRCEVEEGPLTVSRVGEPEEGKVTLRVELEAGGPLFLAMQLEKGEWRLDLFQTESAGYQGFSFEPRDREPEERTSP